MHGQRFALEYASLNLDRRERPVLQALEMLGKAGFTNVRDVLPVHSPPAFESLAVEKGLPAART